MTEQEWLACTNPLPMLEFLREKASGRKLRLFGMACCRRIPRLLDDAESANNVLCADRILEGNATPEELEEARNKALEASRDPEPQMSIRFATAILMFDDAFTAARQSATVVAPCVASDPLPRSDEVEYRSALRTEITAQAELLRHIVGNPFRPYVTPHYWPTNIVQLADALYNGENSGFAIQDALLEIGHGDLSQHFLDEKEHPKGCWVLDLLLGKN
jgi:hypothetical protein